MSKQRDPNSWWERTKFNLPFAFGLLIWTIIWMSMVFSSDFFAESLISRVFSI